MGNIDQIILVGDYARGNDSGLIEVFLIGKNLNMNYISQLESKIEKLIKRKVSFYLASKFISERENIVLFNSSKNDFYRKERPWGCFYVIHNELNYKLKDRSESWRALSYQYHHKRSEAWTIVKGIGTITLDGQVNNYSEGDTILIPQGVKHRIENKNSKVIFIEVQTGSYFGEDDMVK